MLAEIKKKAVEKDSEDQLTGNIFGTLRYMPFDVGMGEILSEVHFREDSRPELDITAGPDWSTGIDFWRKVPGFGEPDILIELTDTVILIEVKLYSPISSEDDPDDEVKDYRDSENQLSKYSRYLTKTYRKSKEKILIILAREYEAYTIWKDAKDRNIISDEVRFGYLSWTDICNILEKNKSSSTYPDTIIMTDMVDLLKRKNLDAFKSFDDIVSAASGIDKDNIWTITDIEESNEREDHHGFE